MVAHSSSIVSNAVVALSQLHFIRFSQDMLKQKPSRSLQLELLMALFLLTCFELIDEEDIHRTRQTEWADYLLQEFVETDSMTEQIIHWLILCDVKLVVFGGSGTISRRSPHVYDLGSCKPSPQSDVAVEETTTQHFTTENSVSLSPDRLREGVSHRETSVAWSHPCSPVLVLKEGILRDAVVFHRRSQQFLRKIAMLDRHHRSRGSAQDEAEVTTTAGRLANDLHRLSHDRPSIMHCSPEDLHQLL
ncbi:uncharacterized protein BDW43DRAFT_147938 [Aspergillus alliaceus]|uniref:uncharacterized protein n=1 Tax=Petromyces alliaceus TaxID=209559 RepID=UPI0012A6D86F|nr:uncharacterized protein BDW43DRAFT_147938 [Aspergillus alliaceus]KAB8230985.1 hypothetical protein BDW43DRAFT_147938 [Aspergillus alliaceus]